MNKSIFVHIWGIARVFFKRLPYILICMALFMGLAYGLDYYLTKQAPADDFLKYEQFTVQNAREGENVSLTVCRQFKEKYKFGGDLTIKIVADPTEPSLTRDVFNLDLQGSLKEECENKSILAAPTPRDPTRKFYRHAPGKYRMFLHACVRVKYNIEKCADRTSNDYTIYPDPTTLTQRVEQLQQELQAIQELLGQKGGSTPVAQSQPTQGATGPTGQTGATGAQGPTGPQGPSGTQSNQGLIPDNVPILGRL